jgi:hypothetical protein
VKACTAVLVEPCQVDGCDSEELAEVGHGGGAVFFECDNGHFAVISTATLHEMLED